MPTINENKIAWTEHRWPQRGDEWSEAWGGTAYLWEGTILPRIKSFFPTENILEIAPGFGRCTQFLAELSKTLSIVDLNENCIDYCKDRFSSHDNINYFVNDGQSLDMIPDNSIDFVFSWDSLVHVEQDTLSKYLSQLANKLKSTGKGFLHHSNAGQFRDPQTGELSIENPHWRAKSMSAGIFRNLCKKAGLNCISQEIVNWGGDKLNDCFSVIAKDNILKKETKIFVNNKFGLEIAKIKKISDLDKSSRKHY